MQLQSTQAKQEFGNPTGFGHPDEWPKYIIEQGWHNYTDEDHDVWKTLFQRQTDIIKNRACDEFFDGLNTLNITENKIPDFDDLNYYLMEKTGFEVIPVSGLIPDLPFFKMLSMRKFPAGRFIRKRAQLDYIQEPDIFHDVFGHVPMLADPVFADYIQAFGEGGLRAHRFDCIQNLSRLYWYTVEFGLMKTVKGLRIYGAGILSSPGETVFALDDDSPHRIMFDLIRIMQTNYRVDDYQQTYFVINSIQDLFDKTYSDFADIYRELRKDYTEHAVDDILSSDKVVTKGTQKYAIGKKGEAKVA